ncbi:MAG: hypothetical protein A2X18_01110 [Bacteroidetes bacterium GWF2_40_14]|nr:MAG: hypothetical protein A2X18_01110 [Bacteroidetes bacterium GWF2_40_14]
MNFITEKKVSSYRTRLLVLILITGSNINGQPRELTLGNAISMALQNNIEYKTYKLNVEQNKALKKSAFTIENTQIFYGSDKNNIAENGYPLNIIGVEQNFNFPTVYTAQYKVNNTAVSLSEMDLENHRLLLIKDVSKEYYEIGYLMNKEYFYKNLDSLYKGLIKEVDRKHKSGTAKNLDLLNVLAKHQQILLSLDHLGHDISIAYKRLMLLINDNSPIIIPGIEPAQLIVSNQPLRINPGVKYKRLATQMQEEQLKVEQNRLLPDITLSFYNGTNKFSGSENYPGYQIGISVPLFFSGQKSKIEAGKIAVSISKNEEEKYLRYLKLRREELMSEIRKLRESLNYFSTTGKKLSDEIVKGAKESYESQEIDLFQYVQSIENAIIIEMEHLDWLAKYNNVVLELNYLEM